MEREILYSDVATSFYVVVNEQTNRFVAFNEKMSPNDVDHLVKATLFLYESDALDAARSNEHFEVFTPFDYIDWGKIDKEPYEKRIFNASGKY